MKNTVLALVSTISVALMAAPVSAQEEAGVTSYDFEDDLVTGDLMRPDGENLMIRKKGRQNSLIRIREHFVPEMLSSVQNL